MALFEDDEFSTTRKRTSGSGTAVNRDETGASISTTPMSTPGLQPEGSSGSSGAYDWQSGNTGISGYGQGGMTLPSFGGTSSGNTGVSGYAPGGKTLPDFNGDYLGYIRSLLPGGTADRSAVDRIESDLAKVGILNQRASDGTSRGRVHLPNGNYVDLVHGSGWGDTWADLVERQPVRESGGNAGNSDLLALLSQMMSGFGAAPTSSAPMPAAAQPMTWPDPASLAPNMGANTAGEIPPFLALQDPGLARAMSSMAMQMPQWIRSQPNNPLMQQLLAVLGG